MLAGPLLHADGYKPNTLTAKEIEEGWILLFDGETTFGWKTEGNVKVDDGQLCIGGKEASSITTTSAFQLCEVKFRYFKRGDARFSSPGGNNSALWVDSPLWWSNGTSLTTVEKDGSVSRSQTSEGMTSGIRTKEAPTKELLATPIRFETPSGVALNLQSIKLRPLNAKPIFNGKDLDGWKVFEDPKRNRSKWCVTKDGLLNVKNGPGDLQSAGSYSDFILQLDCISNGKALNSGVFFRCIANEYQNGYEMQIQNGFKGDDRSKPSDFGTGAIYRRVPARKVVPNDNEWFTMTLVARGKHLATWVNGYQTVDWTDDRKDDDNPRKGARTAAGHLSIQGHDPTTDLSFRNIRVLEFK